jgi:hypothetical protein
LRTFCYWCGFYSNEHHFLKRSKVNMTATARRGTHNGTPIRAVTISRITKMIPTICNVLLFIEKDNIT